MDLLVILILATFLQSSLGACPHTKGDLKKWSEESTWDSGVLPAANTDVNIKYPILIDALAVSEYRCINVKSGGRLVFSPSYNPNLRVHCILIENGGEMHIGSEDCPFTGKVDITLLGEPGDMNVPGFGEKFIGVQAGGTLELHGEKRISWSKLTKTAKKFDPSVGELFRHKNREDRVFSAGAYIYHFNKQGQMLGSIFQRLDKNTQEKQDANIQLLTEFLNDIPVGDIYAFATQREITAQDNTKLADALDVVAGPNLFRNYDDFAAYAMVGIKGLHHTVSTGTQNSATDDLQLNPGEAVETVEAMAILTLEDEKRQFVVMSNNSRRESRSLVDFVVMDTDYSQPIITLVDDVKSSWRYGDKLVIASTDYKHNQAEEVTVEDCDDATCASNQVRLMWPLFYTHYGEIYKQVDMRSEVGLLSRNIHIKGEISEGKTNGGHVKFLKGFKSVRVQGVELSQMGQPEVLGRYPLHYHMCEDLSDTSLYPVRSYLKENSIHDTFRCTTIHGTHHAWYERNVCYNTIGHGVFLEDGGEKYTYLYGNLVLGQKRWTGDVRIPGEGVTDPTGAIPTDKAQGPASYWITNPLTSLINNVAAGGDSVGFWCVYPDLPTGPSRDMNFMQLEEARRTKIKEFTGNTAHSYVKAGLFIDNIEQDDLTVSGYNQYHPIKTPMDLASEDVPFIITRLTAYKNRDQNTWIRGSWSIVEQSSFSDSLITATLVKEDKVHHHFINNVVIGDSPNLGQPSNIKVDNAFVPYTTRSIPNPSNPSLPHCGFRFFQGPSIVRNTWFDDFTNTDIYDTSAICFRRCNTQSKSILNIVDNVKFGFDDGVDGGNRVYDGEEGIPGYCNKDGDIGNSILDREGTMLGGGVRILRPIPFHINSNCKLRTNWNMAHCRQYYAQLMVFYTLASGEVKAKTDEVTMMRTDTPYAKHVSDMDGGSRFYTIADGNTGYLMWFSNIDVPSSVGVTGFGVTKSHPILVAFCVPPHATFSVRYRLAGTMVSSVKVDSIADVKSDTVGGKYFYDKNAGVVAVKLLHTHEFTAYDEENFKECPNNQCTVVTISMITGDRTKRDCSAAFIATYGEQSQGTAGIDDKIIPAHSTEPPIGLGAGSTYPFE